LGNFANVVLTGEGGFSEILTLEGQTWSVTSGGYLFSLNQSSGELTVQAVPEPGVWLLGLLGAGALGVLRNRRRSA